jgi:hypothetical protein
VLSDEQFQEIKALRADVQALPERIVSLLARELKSEVRIAWWTLVIILVGYSLFDWLRGK